MASQMISALDTFTLAELATNFDDSLGISVDTLDTSMAPTGTDKKVVGLTLAQYLGLKPIQTITLTSGAPGSFDFTSIPDYGHKDLFFKGNLRSYRASQTVDDIYIYFNNDTTAPNYYHQRFYGNAGTAYATQSAVPQVLFSTAASSPSDAMAYVEILVPDYLLANLKIAQGEFFLTRITGSSVLTGQCAVAHDSMTAAISRITIASGNSANLYGEISLYLKF